MTSEEIIRDEANDFAFQFVDYYSNAHEGHKSFIQSLKQELANFYDPEAKMIFLDQIKISLEAYKVRHLQNCKDEDCEKDKVYSKMLFFLQQEINELPKILKSRGRSSQDQRTQIFISYSHKDKSYLDDLKRHFKPLRSLANFWDDTNILVGQKWKDQIREAIEKAKIAILLVSADFFNSDFIEKNELPPLLRKAEDEGATILVVVLKPCLFEEYPQLNQYQAINSPSRPISSMDETTRELMWVELVRQVKNIITESS